MVAVIKSEERKMSIASHTNSRHNCNGSIHHQAITTIHEQESRRGKHGRRITHIRRSLIALSESVHGLFRRARDRGRMRSACLVQQRQLWRWRTPHGANLLDKARETRISSFERRVARIRQRNSWPHIPPDAHSWGFRQRHRTSGVQSDEGRVRGEFHRWRSTRSHGR